MRKKYVIGEECFTKVTVEYYYITSKTMIWNEREVFDRYPYVRQKQQKKQQITALSSIVTEMINSRLPRHCKNV